MHSDLERPERLQVMLRTDELLALDNWRFEKRMPSRAAAIRELLRRGLASEGFLSTEAGMKSGDYAVVPATNGDGSPTEE
jgi:metal-responsive CopG/Arc/MetJ family transcriptional regulator